MTTNKYLKIYNDFFLENDNEIDNENKINLNIIMYCFKFFDNNYNDNNTKEGIINLLDSEYVIFPTNKFFNFYRYKLLKYFKKTKIVCLNYYSKHLILRKLNEINKVIKSKEKKYLKFKLNILKLLKINNLKEVYFLENQIEPDTLYKKIKFGSEEIFMNFNTYAYKKIEYKLKTLCQLVEKLGATEIDIRYTREKIDENNIEANIDGMYTEIGIKIKNTNNKKSDFIINKKFNELNQINNINLNIYELEKIIEKETEFYISKEDFKTDIDIKFLVNSRCINLVEKYNTKIVFEYTNKFERQLITKASKFGIFMDFTFNKEDKEELYIEINFLDPFKYLDCINGYNISPYSSGFNHLSKLIKTIENINFFSKEKKNNDIFNENTIYLNNTVVNDQIVSVINCNKKDKELYIMINYFLEAHMKLYNEKKNLLDVNIGYNKNINLVEVFENIINNNFTSEELYLLFYNYFKNNLSYKIFEKFRNILIKPIYNFFEFTVKSNYFNLKINNKYKYNFYQNIINNYDLKKINRTLKINYNENDDKLDDCDECYKLKEIEKLVFISYQYHNILNYKLKICEILNDILEKIKINLIKTCDNIYNIILEESKDWKFIFETIHEIKNNNINSNKINKLYKKYNINYLNNIKSIISSISPIKNKKRNSENFQDKKFFFEYCKEDYDRQYNQNIHYNKSNYDINKIQKLIINYMNKSLLDILNQIKLEISSNNLNLPLNNLNININNYIPKYSYLIDIKNKSNSKIIYEPKLFLSFNKNNLYFDIEELILQILCFSMNIFDENNNKNQSNITLNFNLLASEIKNTFEKFFYQEHGFFDKKKYNNNSIKTNLIQLYNNIKLSNIDEKVILVFNLLFEENYMDFTKLNTYDSVFDSMYLFISDIIKNYENYNKLKDVANIKYIMRNFSKNKLILTYKIHKIFFTYEDFSKYFYDNYSVNAINNYSFNKHLNKFKILLNKINLITFEKIKYAFINDDFSNINYYSSIDTYENEIENVSNKIYLQFNGTPYIMNFINNIIKESHDNKL